LEKEAEWTHDAVADRGSRHFAFLEYLPGKLQLRINEHDDWQFELQRLEPPVITIKSPEPKPNITNSSRCPSFLIRDSDGNDVAVPEREDRSSGTRPSTVKRVQLADDLDPG
jgi:hypothetical protein